jgi:hypothetical protein
VSARTLEDQVLRAVAARDFHHEHYCDGIALAEAGYPRCVLCPTLGVIVLALEHLDAHPGDVRSVRRILHDAVCLPGCTGDLMWDHADRTQAGPAAVLHRFHERGAGR